jgi:hypothetical protein
LLSWNYKVKGIIFSWAPLDAYLKIGIPAGSRGGCRIPSRGYKIQIFIGILWGRNYSIGSSGKVKNANF